MIRFFITSTECQQGPVIATLINANVPRHLLYAAEDQMSRVAHLLDRHRLGQVTREVDIEALEHGKPVGNELQRDDVENTLQDVDRLGDLNLLRLVVRELLVSGVADDDGLAAAGND